jgi:hypothetical protein
VGQPQPPLLGLAPHLDDGLDPVVAPEVVLLGLGLDRADDGVEEVADLEPDLFDLGRKGEVDGHPASLPENLTRRSSI